MAEPESPTAASQRADFNPIAHLSSREVPALARAFCKTKERTCLTAKRHSVAITGEKRPVSVVLFGDSMIERMLTTGRCQDFQPWPSEIIFPNTHLQTLNNTRLYAGELPISRMDGVANFGCGGDKIENMLYRLIREPASGLRGLLWELNPPAGGTSAQQKPKLWVISAGSNNLHRKKGLTAGSLHVLDIMLRQLYQANQLGSKFLLTGLFYRKDIPNGLVDEANTKMKELVTKLEMAIFGHSIESASAAKLASDRHEDFWDRSNATFRFLPAPNMDDPDKLFEDHVHLNEEGYRRWMQTLLPKVDEMVRSIPPSVPGLPPVKPFHNHSPPLDEQGTKQ
ncbi:hypothetical protein Daus18300_006184 [Diaporthe australafricana]|uniref:SGNH hydrolase-type esterase domain-containing protein n=1 Tax=Diaporthe australafricana TaxID=127596 RepID=A0ABR3WW55_9PEZI